VKVLVCGGRNYSDSNRLFSVLDAFHSKFNITQIISGGSKGADRLAWEWAMCREIRCISTPAAWNIYGLRAGPLRNQDQLELSPDAGIAFPGGAGTDDMVSRMELTGVPVHRIDWKCQK
jgi:hypothetical protein